MTRPIEITVKANDQASQTFGKIGASAQTMGQQLSAADAGGSGFFAKLANAGGMAAGVVGKLGMVAAGAAAGGIAAIAAGAAGAATAGLSFNNEMEQVTAKLNAFTKDGALSAKILEDIKKEAATTPFAFNEMAQATAGLMSSAKSANIPLMDLVKQAEILAASNPAQGLDGAAYALREAVGGDFTSVIERFDLPRQLIKDLQAQGLPAIEVVRQAMQAMGYDADLVANMANTMQGRWSTFTDTLTNLAATATKPLFTGMSQGLADLQVHLDAAYPQLEGIATVIGEKLGQAFQWLIGQIPAIIGGFQTLWGIIQPGVAVIAALASAFLDAGPFSAEFAESLSLVHPALQDVMNAISGFVSTAWPALQSAFQSIGPIISQVVAVALPLVQVLVASYMERFQALWGVVQAIWPQIQSIILSTVAIIGAVIAEHGPAIMANLTAAWNTINATILALVPPIQQIIQTVFGAVQQFLAQHGPAIAQFLGEAWERISVIVRTGAELVQAIVVPIFTAVASFIAEHKDAIVGIITLAWETIKTVVDVALTLIQGVITTAMQLLNGDWEGAWATVQTTLSTAWDTIEGYVQTAVDTVIGIVTGFKDEIAGLAGSFLTAASDIGTAIVNGIKNGITNAWVGVTSWVSGKIAEIPAAIRSLMGIASPSKVTTEQGEQIAAGIGVGWTNRWPVVTAAVKGGMTNLVTTIQQAMPKMADAFKGGLSTLVTTTQEQLPKVAGEFKGNLDMIVDQTWAFLEEITLAVRGQLPKLAAELKGGLDNLVTTTQEELPKIPAAVKGNLDMLGPQTWDFLQDIIDAAKSQLPKVVDEFQGNLSNLATTATAELDTVAEAIKTGFQKIADIPAPVIQSPTYSGGGPSIPDLAGGTPFPGTGGPSTTRPGNNAMGTTSWRGGWTWVGERGPELLHLPGGAQIRSTADSLAGHGDTIYIDARGAAGGMEWQIEQAVRRVLNEQGRRADIRRRGQ